MENFTDWEMKNLVRELSEGREQARQLQIHLNAQSSSYETREFLLHRIMSSYDHALSMLQVHHAPPPPPVDSPGASLPTAGSPHTDDSDQDNQASRKRKGAPRWTQRVKVSPETGIEGQLDDGYAWRKYGQKDILGAKHPRGYYRCTNRHGQGCLATKQVQKSDEDPTVFVITYRREHTCNPRATTPNPPTASEDPNLLPVNPHSTRQNQDPCFDIQTCLRVKQDPFNFPSSAAINNPPTSDDGPNNNNNINIFENNYFPVDNDFGSLIPNLMHTTESELSTIVAAMTSSGTSTSASGASFSAAGSLGLDSNFSFGDHGYYP